MSNLREYLWDLFDEWEIDDIEHDLSVIAEMDYEASSTVSIAEIMQAVLNNKYEEAFNYAQEVQAAAVPAEVYANPVELDYDEVEMQERRLAEAYYGGL